MKNRFRFFLVWSCLSGLLFSACSGNEPKDNPLNLLASLPASFHFEQKGLRVLSSVFNRKSGQVSMLFGNDIAKRHTLDNGSDPAGAEWALITWETVADKHWFGAEIPGSLVSVETLRTDPAHPGLNGVKYSRFTGKDLVPDNAPADSSRIRQILALQPAVMP